MRPVYQMVYPLIHNKTQSSHKPTLSADTDGSIYAVSSSVYLEAVYLDKVIFSHHFKFKNYNVQEAFVRATQKTPDWPFNVTKSDFAVFNHPVVETSL